MYTLYTYTYTAFYTIILSHIIHQIYFLFLASDGCLQYFTGVSGQMFSFNYNDATVRPIQMFATTIPPIFDQYSCDEKVFCT